ncbi:MAG: type II secretion system F family protein [Galactobacter sp.]
MSDYVAAVIAGLACALFLLLISRPKQTGRRERTGRFKHTGKFDRTGTPENTGTLDNTAGRGVSAARTAGAHDRWGPKESGGTDPLADDVAAEALGQAVALLQAGVSATELFRVWGSTRASDALDPAGRRLWLGEDGEPSALTRKGRERVKASTLRTQWLAALAAADLQLRSGGDLVSVQGPGLAWQETVWAVGLATGTGAPLADLLERVRDECTARADAARARVSGLAAARTTRRILMSLPIGGLLLAQALGAEPLNILVGTVWGRAALVLGLIFWGVAALWSRRIMRAGTP